MVLKTLFSRFDMWKLLKIGTKIDPILLDEYISIGIVKWYLSRVE